MASKRIGGDMLSTRIEKISSPTVESTDRPESGRMVSSNLPSTSGRKNEITAKMDKSSVPAGVRSGDKRPIDPSDEMTSVSPSGSNASGRTEETGTEEFKKRKMSQKDLEWNEFICSLSVISSDSDDDHVDIGGMVSTNDDVIRGDVASVEPQETKKRKMGHGKYLESDESGYPPSAVSSHSDDDHVDIGGMVIRDDVSFRLAAMEQEFASLYLDVTKDDCIIAEMPERYQWRLYPPAGKTKINEIRDESNWIYQNQFNSFTVREMEPEGPGGQRSSETLEKIESVLKLMRDERLELPYIIRYCKTRYWPDLNVDDLWLIYDCDEKWNEFNKFKSALERLWEGMRYYQTHDPNLQGAPGDFRRVSDSELMQVKRIQTMEECYDYGLQFLLYYGLDHFGDMKSYLTQLGMTCPDRIPYRFGRHLERMAKYFLVSKSDANVVRLASKFGLKPEELGENLLSRHLVKVPGQISWSPAEAAQAWSLDYPSAIEAAMLIAATEFAHNPLVRRAVRRDFFRRAVVNVESSRLGRLTITETDPCYWLMSLKDHPAHLFVGDQFLRLAAAEQQGLVKVTITMDPSFEPDGYLNEVKHCFQYTTTTTQPQTANIREWNELRCRVLKMTLDQFLFADMAEQLATKLVAESQLAVLRVCAERFAARLSVAPIWHSKAPDDDDLFPVMGFAYGSHNEPCYCALVHRNGTVLDYLWLENWMRTEGQNGPMTKVRQLQCADDDNRLRRFMRYTQPRIIAVCAESFVASQVHKRLADIVHDEFEHGHIRCHIPVEYVPPELSQILATESRTEGNAIVGDGINFLDYGNYPAKLIQAISVARLLQDPLAEFAQLCPITDWKGEKRELLRSFPLHELQRFVAPDKLYNVLYNELLKTVNHFGVDLEVCLEHPYRATLLQFVCGLGPKKTIHLMNDIRLAPLMKRRVHLKQLAVIDENTFTNCAGFIKFRLGPNSTANALDATRIHPADYNLAYRFIFEAFHLNPDDVQPLAATSYWLGDPERLANFDTDSKKCADKQKIILSDIQAELRNPFGCALKPYRSPNPLKLFRMLAGETGGQTVCEEQLVLVRVVTILRKPPQHGQIMKEPLLLQCTQWVCRWCCQLICKHQNLESDADYRSKIDRHLKVACPGRPYGILVELKRNDKITGIIDVADVGPKFQTLVHGGVRRDPVGAIQPNSIIECCITEIIPDDFTLKLRPTNRVLCSEADLDEMTNENQNGDQPGQFAIQDILELVCQPKSVPETDKRISPEGPSSPWSVCSPEPQSSSPLQPKSPATRFAKCIEQHPRFANVDPDTAIAMMEQSPLGHVLIRPSSRRNELLILTWKMHENANQSAEVFVLDQTERPKFLIFDEVYHSLEDILQRYVEPQKTIVSELFGSKHFRHDVWGIDACARLALNSVKASYPNGRPFIISASKEQPGNFVLSYMLNQQVYHLDIKIYPKGLKVLGSMFDSVKHFLRHVEQKLNTISDDVNHSLI